MSIESEDFWENVHTFTNIDVGNATMEVAEEAVKRLQEKFRKGNK